VCLFYILDFIYVYSYITSRLLKKKSHKVSFFFFLSLVWETSGAAAVQQRGMCVCLVVSLSGSPFRLSKEKRAFLVCVSLVDLFFFFFFFFYPLQSTTIWKTREKLMWTLDKKWFLSPTAMQHTSWYLMMNQGEWLEAVRRFFLPLHKKKMRGSSNFWWDN
jgi:hypothetical protein